LPEEDHIEAAVIDKTVYLKPFGFATQHNCLGVPNFLRAMFRMGCCYVAFDLSDCRGMDSTFLGVVADAATSNPHRSGKCVTVLNADEGLVRQLCRIGLLPLVSLHEEPAEPPDNLQLSRIDFVHFPKGEQQRLRTVQRMHRQLVQINERNRRLFGPFINMIEEELDREELPPAQ
jgi:hypothetical protein